MSSQYLPRKKMIDIEPKGFSGNKLKSMFNKGILAKWRTKTEKPVTFKNPPPEFKPTFWDGLGEWLQEAAVNVALKVVGGVIPMWFWFALLGAIILIIIIVL